MGLYNTQDLSVKWGDVVDRGMGGRFKTYPFIYPFINRRSDTYDLNKGSNPLDSLGVVVPSGATIQHYVQLDPDCNYIPLWYKYSVYWNDSGIYRWYDPVNKMFNITGLNNRLRFDDGAAVTAVLTPGRYSGTALAAQIKTQLDLVGSQVYTVTYTNGKFTISAPAAFSLVFTGNAVWTATGALLGFNTSATYTGQLTYTAAYATEWELSQFDYQAQFGPRLIDYIGIRIAFPGSKDTILYGGKNLDDIINNLGAWWYVSTKAVQGYEYGYGQMYTPYMLPKDSPVMFEIKNSHPVKDLLVAGMMYGVKVRM